MGCKSAMPAENRVELVLALLRKEGLAAQIAHRAWIREPTLYRGRDEFITGGEAQLGGKGNEAVAARVLAKLQRESDTRSNCSAGAEARGGAVPGRDGHTAPAPAV